MTLILAGPVEFDPATGLLLLLMLVVIPGLAVAGVVLLLVALSRHLRKTTGTTSEDLRARRRTKRLAIAGGLMCVPMVVLLGVQLWFRLQFREMQTEHVANLGFVVYEPTYVPPGYRIEGDTNPFRDPPYVDYYMTDGLHVTQFEHTSQVGGFLDTSGVCDPALAIGYLIGGTASLPTPTATLPCRALVTTAEGYVLYGTGQPAYNGNEVLFTQLGDTVIVFEFSSMYQGDRSELAPLVDSMSPVEPDSLVGREGARGYYESVS